MTIEIPGLCLVVLVGPAGAGKSTFAGRRFRPTEVVSSDACRALVADDERDLTATDAAFEVLHLIASLRLARRRLTVVDAVCARPGDRAPLLRLAEQLDCAAIAIVLALPEEVCIARDRARPGRTVGRSAISRQWAAVQRSLPGLEGEGFAAVHVLRTPEQVDAVAIRRLPLAVDRRGERGPFDVIGDVHGRVDALVALLERLGYRVAPDRAEAVHPDGRRAVFAGDVVGGGPGDAAAARLVRGMAGAGSALAVLGDRDQALASGLPEAEAAFLLGLPSHLVLAGGDLVVAHAGMRSDLQGRESPRVTRFALAAEPGWADAHRGRALVVHGHEPEPCPRWRGRTLGLNVPGTVTGLRYPEREVVAVPAET